MDGDNGSCSKKTYYDQPNDNSGNAPLQEADRFALRRHFIQDVCIYRLFPIPVNARNVSCPNHCNYPFPWGGPDLIGKVLIPFVDQDAPQSRKNFPDFRKQRFEDILILHPLDIFFFNLTHVSNRSKKLSKQFDLCPKSHETPGPRQCGADIPVCQMYTGADCLGALNGFPYLLTRLHSELLTDFLLERCEHKI